MSRWRRLTPLRRLLVGALVLLFVAALWDWSRAPSRQWTVRFERAAIARYQAWLSPWLGRAGVRCRFEPSCSQFARAALAKDGALAGNLRIAWRLLRCGPWTTAGTSDPP